MQTLTEQKKKTKKVLLSRRNCHQQEYLLFEQNSEHTLKLLKSWIFILSDHRFMSHVYMYIYIYIYIIYIYIYIRY